MLTRLQSIVKNRVKISKYCEEIGTTVGYKERIEQAGSDFTRRRNRVSEYFSNINDRTAFARFRCKVHRFTFSEHAKR